MAQPRKDTQDESRRILKRLDAEEGNLLGRTAQRLENHLNASDAPQHDSAELWGTRIGRLIALALTLVVIAWALAWLFAG